MQRRSIAGDLILINLEINATCRRHNIERIRNFLHDLEAAATPKEEPRSSKASSSFPIPGQSHTDLIEEVIMAEEPRRVTQEDYPSPAIITITIEVCVKELTSCKVKEKDGIND